MTPEQQARIKEYAERIQKGNLAALILEESRDLERLLRARVFEIEYGYWIYGED